MTMRIVVLRDDKKEKHVAGEEYFIDRAKALQMIEEGKATTPNLYEKIIKKKAEETAKREEEEKKAAEKAKEEAAKKAAEEKKAKEEKATSKSFRGRTKAVKK